MKYVIGVGCIVVGCICFVLGWWLGSQQSLESHPPSPTPSVSLQQLESSLGQKEEQLAALRIQLAALRIQLAALRSELTLANRDRATQKAMIREHNLTQSTRSLDELLALFPAKFPAGNWPAAETDFEDCWFETVDGMRLHGWLLRLESAKVAILYAHGNAGNVSGRARIAQRLHEQFNASVFVFDYRGYGRSEGIPTVAGLAHDTRAARNFLAQREEIKPTDVVLLGRSLGAALVTQLAAEDGARGLILQSPFASLKEAASGHYPAWLVNVLVADRLNSRDNIANYQGPLLISHGASDRTIAFEQGVALFEAANEPKSFFRIERGSHNSPLPETYYSALAKFLSDLP